MRLRFDARQPFQLRAIEAVASLFAGQPRVEPDLLEFGAALSPIANRLDLDEVRLLANLRAVQNRNGLPADESLRCIEQSMPTAEGTRTVRFPNYSVEMETGTGKTYVYLRTAFELFARYGWRKFIVVVPSVAVREGVLKTLQITERHLKELYGNAPYRYTVYDSKSISKVRQFAQSDHIELLVMTIDSFTKADNVIRQSTDRLQGATPLYLIQAARPVLILDEPQNMESDARVQALATLRPLAALRYSATHRDPYNRVYCLGPFDAYRQGLVKHIEVASVVREGDTSSAYVRVEEIRSTTKQIEARITVHKRMANGTIKAKDFWCRVKQSLADRAGRSDYDSFVITAIDGNEGVVRFSNGVSVRVGDEHGANREALFRAQIAYTIEEHFRKQQRVLSRGIKVLSLFFIDRVASYTGADPDGLVRRLFDEEFDRLRQLPRYRADWGECRPADVRKAYFAERKRVGGATEAIDSTSGESKEDRSAYDLIMRQKEKLLSFAEPAAFIFSHSALKEGWDNPNVFQICTLNQTASETKKRQEIGRGLRLAVTQQGERVHDPEVNVLTVIVNESYGDFVQALQQETREEFGEAEAAKMPKPTKAKLDKAKATRPPLTNLPPEFEQLWERIKHRTRYRVQVDTETLIAEVTRALNALPIAPAQVRVSRAEVRVGAKGDTFEARLTAQGQLADLSGRGPTPNLLGLLIEVLEQTDPPVRLTRHTLCRILQGVTNLRAALDNPQDFVAGAVQAIKDTLAEQLVAGIQYERDGTEYDLSLWEEAVETSSELLASLIFREPTCTPISLASLAGPPCNVSPAASAASGWPPCSPTKPAPTPPPALCHITSPRPRV